VLNLNTTGDGFTDRDMTKENFRPMLDSPEALSAAEFLVELLAVSPDTVLQMSWFERAQCYTSGHSAMAYCYTQIMPMFMSDPAAPAHGRSGYAPHPAVTGTARIAPLGGWNLCVPANIRSERLPAVRDAVRVLTSPEATKLYIENGSLVSSRFSVCNDPAVAHGRPIIPIVDRLARAGQLQAWVRPAVAELNDLVRILGEEIHMMLLRNKKPVAALRDAQARCDNLMRQNGRY
jgi:multiple sugar transport system substrate-binding protein